MTRTARAILAALLGLTVAGSVAPALAAGNAPPVTRHDDLTLLVNGSRRVDFTVNDEDDGDDLALCRVARSDQGRLLTFMVNGHAFVSAVMVTPRRYRFAYQACDRSYLSVGHVTVHVVRP